MERSPVRKNVSFLVAPTGPRVLPGLGAEVVDGLLRMVIEVGDQDGRQRGLQLLRRQRGPVGRAAHGHAIVEAVVVVPTLEL